MRSARPRGIVLFSVMLVAILIAMYVTSSAMLSKGQLGVWRQSAEDRRAEEAARSGLEYAQARLEEDPLWRGNGQGTVVDTPTLKVREDRGNVVGVLSTSDGGRAQFRLRFNFQDGGGGGDAMVDPSTAMWSDSPHISVNNLLNLHPVALPIAEGSQGVWRGKVASSKVPGSSVALVCEGRVFPELDGVTAADLNMAPSRVQAARTIEAFYRVSDISGETPAQDAVTMAGRDVEITLFPNLKAASRVALSNFQGLGPSQLRSRGDVSVWDAEKNRSLVEGKEAKILLPNNKNLEAVLAGGVQRGPEDMSGDFYKLTWEEAAASTGAAKKVPAGVYVFWASDQKLHYYDMNYRDYLKTIKANPTHPGTVIDSPEGFTFVQAGQMGPDEVTSSKHRFVITEDLEIVANEKVKDFTIMPRGGAKEDLGASNALQSGSGSGGPSLDLTGFGVSDQMIPQEALTALVSSPSFVSNLNVHSPAHQLLRAMADTANLNIASPGAFVGGGAYSAGGAISWNENNFTLNNVGGAESWVLGSLLSGQLELEGVVNPNPDVLEPVGASGRYRVKLEGFGNLLFGAGGGGNLAELDLEELSGGAIPRSSEPLTVRDFEVTLAPQNQSGVHVTAPGDLRIAADLRGSGASLSAKGDIRLVGVGFDLDAGQGEEGTDVSLYAEGNISISTLRKKSDDSYGFAGLALRGVVYSWGDIEMKMSHPDESVSDEPQKVYVQGTMVAYGGHPGKDRPGKKGGNIRIRADQVDLVFDPGYLLGVANGKGYKVTLAPLSLAYR